MKIQAKICFQYYNNRKTSNEKDLSQDTKILIEEHL